MSFGDWYVSRGRITRRTYWLYYVLPLLAASIVASLLDVAFGLRDISGSGDFSSNTGPISLIVSLLLLVPSISSNVTRLHDRGHSAWWLLWGLLPIIGWIVLIVQTWFLPGTSGSNQYGEAQSGQPMADPAYPQSYS